MRVEIRHVSFIYNMFRSLTNCKSAGDAIHSRKFCKSSQLDKA